MNSITSYITNLKCQFTERVIFFFVKAYQNFPTVFFSEFTRNIWRTVETITCIAFCMFSDTSPWRIGQLSSSLL